MIEFDNRMYTAGREIILFMDNASVHKGAEGLDLRAVKVVFFPCNTTSCTQPLDVGIIQSLKLKYRKQVHEHMLSYMSFGNPINLVLILTR